MLSRVWRSCVVQELPQSPISNLTCNLYKTQGNVCQTCALYWNPLILFMLESSILSSCNAVLASHNYLLRANDIKALPEKEDRTTFSDTLV